MKLNNLEETINHCEEEAERIERNHPYIDASEYRQLAEWLRKLKAYEEAREEIVCLPIVWKEDVGVRKCIGILDKYLMEVNTDE